MKLWLVAARKDHLDCLSSAVVVAETAQEAEELVRKRAGKPYDSKSDINFDLPQGTKTELIVTRIPMRRGVVHTDVWWGGQIILMNW